MEKSYEFTKSDLTRAFEQWLADYKKDPERFADSYPDSNTEYGRSCADCLVDYLTKD